jgi:hypothetical protein
MTRQTTLRIAGLLAILFLAWPASLPAFQAPASDLAESVMRPAAPGFAPVNESIFFAILALANPGPGRAARALAIADRQLDFQRELWLDREFSPGVRDILEQLPPRQRTLLRAASLYNRDDIRWDELPNRTRQISVAGAGDRGDYLFELTNEYLSPERPFQMAGAFTLSPSPSGVERRAGAVDGRVDAELLTDSYGADRGIDFVSALLRFVGGDFKSPWNSTVGVFDHHDRAALDRFHAQLPAFSAKLENYVKFVNVLDEFDGGGKPVVLFNLSADVKADALKPFPALYKFYKSVGPAVVAKASVTDMQGNYLMQTGFEQGRIRVIFMLRDGLLVPFNASYRQAAAAPLDLAHMTSMKYRTISSATINRFGMTFGLSDLRFVSIFQRDPEGVQTQTSMESVPRLVAPRGFHRIFDLAAGKYLRTLAQGDGGFKVSFSSRTEGERYRYSVAARAELASAPGLKLLARVGDSAADEHSEEVQLDEEKLGQALFDAFMRDYNSARRGVLALDRTTRETR